MNATQSTDCQNCHKTFLAQPSELRRGKARFCSPSCWGLSRRLSPEQRRAKRRFFHRKYKDQEKIQQAIYRMTPRGIYLTLTNRANMRERYRVVITSEQFTEWYEAEPKQCYYCGIPADLLSRVAGFNTIHAQRLSIDRLDNSRHYELGNIALACMRCNITKSNFFTAEEMKSIATKFITPKWKRLLH